VLPYTTKDMEEALLPITNKLMDTTKDMEEALQPITNKLTQL